jgi:hypothetical protein
MHVYIFYSLSYVTATLEKYTSIKAWLTAVEGVSSVKDAILSVTEGKGAAAFRVRLHL